MPQRWNATLALALCTLALHPAAIVRAGEPSSDGREPVLKAYAVADLITPIDPTAVSDPQVDFGSLADLLRLKTGLDCWVEGGGSGSIVPETASRSLIIRQTQDVHSRIAEILDEVRSSMDVVLCYEISLLSGDLQAVQKNSDASPFGLVDADGRERLLKRTMEQAGACVTYAPRITAFAGQSVRIDRDGQPGLEFHSLLSPDQRYIRAWLQVHDDHPKRHELLIPDGFTAVRELSAGRTWMLITLRVLRAREPQEASPKLPSPSSNPEGQRFPVPMDDGLAAASGPDSPVAAGIRAAGLPPAVRNLPAPRSGARRDGWRGPDRTTASLTLTSSVPALAAPALPGEPNRLPALRVASRPMPLPQIVSARPGMSAMPITTPTLPMHGLEFRIVSPAAAVVTGQARLVPAEHLCEGPPCPCRESATESRPASIVAANAILHGLNTLLPKTSAGMRTPPGSAVQGRGFRLTSEQVRRAEELQQEINRLRNEQRALLQDVMRNAD
ncbi:MAG: hypothetical protein KF774_07610 [Planctomyces sp.]|nr:hypothetical protein [Planctomyces sp.]